MALALLVPVCVLYCSVPLSVHLMLLPSVHQMLLLPVLWMRLPWVLLMVPPSVHLLLLSSSVHLMVLPSVHLLFLPLLPSVHLTALPLGRSTVPSVSAALPGLAPSSVPACRSPGTPRCCSLGRFRSAGSTTGCTRGGRSILAGRTPTCPQAMQPCTTCRGGRRRPGTPQATGPRAQRRSPQCRPHSTGRWWVLHLEMSLMWETSSAVRLEMLLVMLVTQLGISLAACWEMLMMAASLATRLERQWERLSQVMWRAHRACTAQQLARLWAP